MYTDESDVKQIGEGRLENITSRDVEVKITYGYTELLVEAREKDKSGEYAMKVMVDFTAE